MMQSQGDGLHSQPVSALPAAETLAGHCLACVSVWTLVSFVIMPLGGDNVGEKCSKYHNFNNYGCIGIKLQ